MHTKFLSENLKGRDSSERLAIDGKITLEWIMGEMWQEIVDWMHLGQDRDQWWILVNTPMNEPSGSIKGGKFVD
jgi:hypothetical protein